MTDRFSWSDIEKALHKIGEISPRFINQALVVGGGSALCYNALLKSANHSRFQFVAPKGNQSLFSKDLDFTHVFLQDYEKDFSAFLKIDKSSGTRFLEIKGVRIGFLQAPCTFHPEEELKCSKKIALIGTSIQVNILDPVSLFREKTYLMEKRGKPNDSYHQEIAKTYIFFEFYESFKNPKKKEYIFQRVKDKAPELLPELNRLIAE